MVLTKADLIACLQNEVRILQHLLGKVEPSMYDYRPTPKQRSTLELLQYLTMMGPALVEAAQGGAFDVAAWTRRETAAKALGPAELPAAIAALADDYARSIGAMSDESLREEVRVFGAPSLRGVFIVDTVLCGHAAYRTQLFLYLKACGREELGTTNLWAGMDEAVKAG